MKVLTDVRPRRKGSRGFTLIEVMVAVALGGVVMATAVSTFKTSLDEQALSKREWQAFTIGQQYMELLSALPRTHSLLSSNSGNAIEDVVPGSKADGTCSSIPTGTQHFRVDGLGTPTTTGQYDVCFKIQAGSPFGTLSNVRVVVTYKFGGDRHVLLQTIR